MATYTLWYGNKNSVGNDEYETVEVNGSELGVVKFNDEHESVQFRIIQTEDGAVFIHYVARQRYEATGEVYEYESLEAAAKEYRFVLSKAGVI